MSPFLTVLFALGAFVCWIIVLVAIFKSGDTLYGVAGIFCGIVAFFYGWSKADDLGVKPVMIAWTGCVVAYVISIVAAIGSGGTPVAP